MIPLIIILLSISCYGQVEYLVGTAVGEYTDSTYSSITPTDSIEVELDFSNYVMFIPADDYITLQDFTDYAAECRSDTTTIIKTQYHITRQDWGCAFENFIIYGEDEYYHWAYRKPDLPGFIKYLEGE